MQPEAKLFWSYVLSSCFFVASLIAASLPWSHWAYNINVCPGYNCECIFFGKSFADHFAGGEAVFCQLITFLQVPLFLTAAFLSFYQGRRCLVISRERKLLKRRNGGNGRNPILILKSRSGRTLREGDVLMEEKVVEMEPPSYRASVILIVVSCVCLVVLSGIFLLMVVGYQWSCNEYRKMMVKLLKASGNMAQILTERLACTAIFDFMDYLQPKRRMHDPADYGRKARINTGMSLYLGQLLLLKNVFTWIFITCYHVKLLRNRIRLDRKSYGIDEVDTKKRKR